MENDLRQRALSMAQTIWKTLFWSCSAPVVMSWGISQKRAAIYDEMLGLELKVNGMIHKGSVIVCYDEGHDTFTINLLDKENNCVKKIEDVYADELGKRIDENIERPTNMTAEQYRSRTFVEIVNACH